MTIIRGLYIHIRIYTHFTVRCPLFGCLSMVFCTGNFLCILHFCRGDVGCLLRSSCVRLFHCLELLRNWLVVVDVLCCGGVDVMSVDYPLWVVAKLVVVVNLRCSSWSFLKNYKIVRIIKYSRVILLASGRVYRCWRAVRCPLCHVFILFHFLYLFVITSHLSYLVVVLLINCQIIK